MCLAVRARHRTRLPAAVDGGEGDAAGQWKAAAVAGVEGSAIRLTVGSSRHHSTAPSLAAAEAFACRVALTEPTSPPWRSVVSSLWRSAGPPHELEDADAATGPLRSTCHIAAGASSPKPLPLCAHDLEERHEIVAPSRIIRPGGWSHGNGEVRASWMVSRRR